MSEHECANALYICGKVKIFDITYRKKNIDFQYFPSALFSLFSPSPLIQHPSFNKDQFVMIFLLFPFFFAIHVWIKRDLFFLIEKMMIFYL